ncbi:MAG: hypothetical protein PHT40_04640 [Patescibacteria group bacterium]|nr:hypothetical protein [Patescibacteria group bacterium]
MTEPKWVMHHDDPPCEARLNDDNICPECGFVPDMQSTCFYAYCPVCNLRLKKMQCPRCKKTYKSSDP